MTEQGLLESVKKAVRLTVDAIRTEHPNDALAGYALLTDDGLETLSYLAVTKTALEASTTPDLLFCPTDWPYQPEQAAFDGADLLLRSQARRRADLRGHVDEAFATLVQALAEARTESWFSPDVFLCVLSTDPSPYLDSLETSSVKLLNGTRLVAERKAFLDKWQ